MSYKVYLWLKRLILVFSIIAVALGIWQHNVVLALLSIVLGLVSLLILRSKTNAVLVDERLERITEKAAWGSFMLSTVIFALVSLLFLAFTRQDMLFPQMLGTLFGYVAICMLTLYLILYWVYRRQMGADSEK